MKVLGLDVSKGKVTACVLDEVPTSLKRYCKTYKALEFSVTEADMKALLELDFDAAVMEPSGVHYSRLWAHYIRQTGKVLRWVGHRTIRHFRESNALPNKSDKADALAIAAYSLLYWNNSEAFIDGEAEEIRYLYLQLQSLNRLRVPTINRLRLQLAHECPELADKPIQRKWLENSPRILKAISGERVTPSNAAILERSIGTGIGSFSAGLARVLLELDQQEISIESQISRIYEAPKYEKYRQCFESWGIHGRTAACLLAHVYPIERFLDKGREIIEREDGTKRYRSLASFKLSIGLGKVQYQSGGQLYWKAGGSFECRKALYLWAKTAIVLSPDLTNPKIEALYDYYQNGSKRLEGDQLIHYEPGKGTQRIMRVIRRLVEKIFYELI